MLRHLLPRIAVGGATLVSALSAALLMPLAAHAEPVRITCKWDGNDYSCARSCTQKLPDGATVYYDDGTTITIVDASGKETKFKCQNGNWVQTALIRYPGILGTINLEGSIAGIKGPVGEEVCQLNQDCFHASYIVGPDRTVTGCNPQQVTCFP